MFVFKNVNKRDKLGVDLAEQTKNIEKYIICQKLLFVLFSRTERAK